MFLTASADRLIDRLEFNGTFSTKRLHRAFRSYSLVYVLEDGVVDDHTGK